MAATGSSRNGERTFSPTAWPNWRRALFALAAQGLCRLEEEGPAGRLRVTTPLAAREAPWVEIHTDTRRWRIAGHAEHGERGYFGLCQYLGIELGVALRAADDQPGRPNRLPARRSDD